MKARVFSTNRAQKNVAIVLFLALRSIAAGNFRRCPRTSSVARRRCAADGLGESERTCARGGETVADAGDSGCNAGCRRGWKDRLRARIRIRGPGAARAGLADKQIPHRQRFEAAHRSRADAPDLDAPVQKYVPSFPDKGAKIAARLLAGHLAGIRHYKDDEFQIARHYDSVLEGLKIFADDLLVSPPGKEFHYSSYSFSLLSAVMESAAGENFLAYMRKSSSSAPVLIAAQTTACCGLLLMCTTATSGPAEDFCLRRRTLRSSVRRSCSRDS
jgi:beta-lactamase family protein